MAADNNKHELNIMQRCCVGVLWLLCRTVAVTPRIIRYYVLQEIIYFVMHYVIRYRRGVVMTNLRNSFPDKEEHELRRIARRYDSFLAEQFINTLSVTGISSNDRKDTCHSPARRSMQQTPRDETWCWSRGITDAGSTSRR